MNLKIFPLRFGIILTLIILGILANGVVCFSVSETTPTFYVNSDSVNLRSAPSTAAPILARLQRGQPLVVTVSDGDWQCVRLDNQVVGWVFGKYLSSNPEANAPDVSRSRSPIDELLEYAQSLLNCRYFRGGSTPKGFDCSGFTMHVYSKIGFSLPHQAFSQSRIGQSVEKPDLKNGDLVFFRTLNSPVINHVGIYIGDGDFIHASSGSGYVRINSLRSGYYFHCYQSARRLFNLSPESNS
jgi:cell wall-associated NlpC family hydrolase